MFAPEHDGLAQGIAATHRRARERAARPVAMGRN
jgi:hypothetical protein